MASVGISEVASNKISIYVMKMVWLGQDGSEGPGLAMGGCQVGMVEREQAWAVCAVWGHLCCTTAQSVPSSWLCTSREANCGHSMGWPSAFQFPCSHWLQHFSRMYFLTPLSSRQDYMIKSGW